MDIDLQAAAARKALLELQQAVQAASKLKKGGDRLGQLSQCERLAQRAKTALDGYRLEAGALPASSEQALEHQGSLRTLEESLRQCRAQIDWKRLDAATGGTPTAVATPTRGGDPRQQGQQQEQMTLEQATAAAEQVQGESKASVGRSLKMVLEAEQIGIASLEKMHGQEEQMDRIAEEIEDMKANLKRSKKLLGQIARSAANDRCIQMLCVGITIALMVMIVLAITGHDGGQLNTPAQVRQFGQR